MRISKLDLDWKTPARFGAVSHEIQLASFLSDPLIVSLVTKLVEEGGTETIRMFPRKGQKAHFLIYLMHKLLEREQEKRQRHSALFAENFALFQRVLRSVAFKMVCNGLSTILPSQLYSFLETVLGNAHAAADGVDAFRTMSWIQRADDGALTFRHEALTVVCAAEHVADAFKNRDSISLTLWQPAAPLAGEVCEYAGEIANGASVLGAVVILRQ